jgi:solute:Na+ symporter, SSS family
MVNLPMFLTFIIIFVGVTALGFLSVRWRAGDLNRLQEWGLAGRRFGPLTTWFLMGGDIYTAYVFIATPGAAFATGGSGFFPALGTTLIYPLFFLIYPRFWTIARHRAYVTLADFVQERFSSRILSLAVSLTSIIATLPFMALQLYAVEIALSAMGVPVEISLTIAFLLLSAYTYVSGLRAAGLMAIVKDVMIVIVVLAGLIFIPLKLGGFPHIFGEISPKRLLLQPSQFTTYSTLALGTSLGLILFPQYITGILSANSRKAIRVNSFLLPVFTIMTGLFSFFGYMAVAAHIPLSPIYKTNMVLVNLFAAMFPSWFVGFMLAALTLSGLVPTSIMSIGIANIFSRNIYREFIRPSCTDREEANVAKLASLVAKVGALAFILFLPTPFAVNFQLLGGALIVQILPSVVIGLYTNWFHRWALTIGWAVGILACIGMNITLKFQSQVFPFTVGHAVYPIYTGIASLIINLLVSVVLTQVFKTLGFARGQDATSIEDYLPQPVGTVEAYRNRQLTGASTRQDYGEIPAHSVYQRSISPNQKPSQIGSWPGQPLL